MKKAYQLKQASDANKQVFHHPEKTSIRINKYLSSSGFCSRRKADKLIEEQRVSIDGTVVCLASMKSAGAEAKSLPARKLKTRHCGS